MSSAPMLDPRWTPAAGYAHAAALMGIRDSVPTIPHERRELEVPETKKSATGTADKSTKISARHYRIAQRLARRDRRSIKTTIELGLERLEAEGSKS